MSAARAAIDAAFEAGITLFDTADIYGFGEQGFGKAEELLGRVFAEAPGISRPDGAGDQGRHHPAGAL